MRKHYCLIIAILYGSLFLILIGLPEAVAGDAEIEGVVFEASYVQNGHRLTLRGHGLLRYMVFYKAYAGAFYLEESSNINMALEDVARRLVLHYFHPMKTKIFAFF